MDGFVPPCKAAGREAHGYFAAFAGGKAHFVESHEFLFFCDDIGWTYVTQIDLRHFTTCTCTAVRYGKTQLYIVAVGFHLQVAIGETRVRETMAKWKQRRNVLRIVPAIADRQAFRIVLFVI